MFDTTLKIGYFYPELLNLYGDTGNVEILRSRAIAYGFNVEIVPISIETSLDANFRPNLVFMGGGPDSSQKKMYEDLIFSKNKFLTEYINSGGVGLYICGAYQLLGKFYKSADGSILNGLGIFDLYTEHFGFKYPRCIGNTHAQLVDELFSDSLFPKTVLGKSIVGFENHGGRTYLGADIKAFSTITKGFGNNGSDSTEGAIFKNSIGSYFHGPLLSKNPHIADYLIFKALQIDSKKIATLPKIDDILVIAAHTASRKIKR